MVRRPVCHIILCTGQPNGILVTRTIDTAPGMVVLRRLGETKNPLFIPYATEQLVWFAKVLSYVAAHLRGTFSLSYAEFKSEFNLTFKLFRYLPYSVRKVHAGSFSSLKSVQCFKIRTFHGPETILRYFGLSE